MRRTHARHPAARGPLGGSFFLLLVILAVPTGALCAPSSDNVGPQAARIATAQGAVFVRGGAQGDWGYADPSIVLEEGDEVLAGSRAEVTLEFPRGIFVTLSEGSRLAIHRFRPGLYLRLRYGTFHVVLLDDLQGYERARIEWPRGNLYVSERGAYRADVFRDGLARVATLRGEAVVSASGGRSLVDAGEVVYVEPGGLPTNEGSYLAGDFDAYDHYALDRVFGAPWASLPPHLAGYGAVGLRQLSQHGQWLYVPEWGKYAWRPRGVARSWRPYRDGRWAFTGLGPTWFPREPWGFAPFHYGRWGFLPRYGWLWQPGSRFSPAWVQFGQSGNMIGWGVIGPNNQMVVPPASLYGSPYVFMAKSDFKTGKPVKALAPKPMPQDAILVDDPSTIVEPGAEAKIKAPRVKPGHPAPADQAAKQVERAALKAEKKAQREAEREAHDLGPGGKGKGVESTDATGTPEPTPVETPDPIPGGGAGEAPGPPPTIVAPTTPAPGSPPDEDTTPPPEETTPTSPPEAGSDAEGTPPSTPPPAPIVPQPGVSPPSPGTPTITPLPTIPAPGIPGTTGVPGPKGKKGAEKPGVPKAEAPETP